MTRTLKQSLLAAIVATVVPTIAPAAVITGAAIDSPALPANLTTIGTVDWTYWNSSSGTGVASQSASNRKSGVTPRISAATAIAGVDQEVRGSSTPTAITFQGADGIGAVTSLGVSGVFNETLNTAGTGVAVSVTLPDTQLYKVSVWVSGYNAVGTFTASLAGATTYTSDAFSYGNSKVARLYELDVQASNPGDLLNLSYKVKTVVTGGSTHALIGGVAVSLIPEPASMALLAPLMLLPLRRRRA